MNRCRVAQCRVIDSFGTRSAIHENQIGTDVCVNASLQKKTARIHAIISRGSANSIGANSTHK